MGQGTYTSISMLIAEELEVEHSSTGRCIEYGTLAADAARLPVPHDVALKRPADFKLIGTLAKRLDTPAKVNGTAVYGIDARPPGVKIATLAQSPVLGGRVKSVNDAAARAVKGVRQIVRLDDAVAVEVCDPEGRLPTHAVGSVPCTFPTPPTAVITS
jgi:isoquinoline 1-oxidoreductase subunit beta